MKKQLKSIAKSITVFILLIFCAVVIDARAEDYLWEPTLAWEDPSPGIGHKLLNNDEWLIYYADNKVQLRELATGKKLAESEDLLVLLNEKGCGSAYFSMSNDGKLIYCLSGFTNTRHLFIFDSENLKIVKKIKVILRTSDLGTHFTYQDSSKFYLGTHRGGYIVSDNDYRIILKTNYDYQGNYPTPGGNIPFKPDGVCIISFNPNSTDELDLRNKDSYKMLFYNESGFFIHNGFYHRGGKFHYLDLISMKDLYSNERLFTISPNRNYILQEMKDKIDILDFETKSVVKTYSSDELKIDTFYYSNVSLPFRLIKDNNPERIFPFSDYGERICGWNYMPNLCFAGKERGIINVFPEKFGNIYIRPGAPFTDKNNKFLLIASKRTMVYAIEPKSNVNTDEEHHATRTDSINAYLPIKKGKYPYFMSIYTSDGKLLEEVKEIKIDRDYIKHNIELLPAGLYLLRLSYEDGNTMTYKIVK